MEFRKIALFSEEFPPYTIGGVGTFCYNLANWLSRNNVYTKVFCCGSTRLTNEKLNDYLEVVRLPFLDVPPKFFWFQLRNLFAISKELEDVSLIHAMTPEVSPICVFLKKKLKLPLVTSYHGVTSYELKAFINGPSSQWTIEDFVFHVLEYPFYHAANNISITNSNQVVTCSYAILNELKNVYPNLDLRKSSVIYNGIDLNEIEAAKEISKNKNHDRTLIFYGRLSWLKGTHYLLEAFKLLIDTYPDLRLKIFGRGPMEKQINATISRYDLKDKIHVYGQIPRTQLLSEIIGSEIVILPSLREAQPISVLEAMACKKPVVVFDLPFVSEYIRDQSNGLLAIAQNSNDLAQKISILLSDRKLREKIGENSYQYIKKYHNWETLIEKYLAVYEKSIKGPQN